MWTPYYNQDTFSPLRSGHVFSPNAFSEFKKYSHFWVQKIFAFLGHIVLVYMYVYSLNPINVNYPNTFGRQINSSHSDNQTSEVIIMFSMEGEVSPI